MNDVWGRERFIKKGKYKVCDMERWTRQLSAHWIWSLFLTTLPLRVVGRGHVSRAQPLLFGFLLLCFLKSLRQHSLDQDPRSQAFTVLCSMYSGISSCLSLSPAWEPNREISLCIFQCTKGGPRILGNCPSTFRDWVVEWYLHCLGAEKELEPLYEKNRIKKKFPKWKRAPYVCETLLPSLIASLWINLKPKPDLRAELVATSFRHVCITF